MHVKYVAGISLPAWRLPGQQRDLAVGRGVLGQVVENDQCVLAPVAKIFRHRHRRERRDPLKSRRTRRLCDDDEAALGRPAAENVVNGAAHARTLLSDGDIDADDIAVLLVDDRIDADRRFADGAVANNKLTLPAPQREQGVYDDQARLNGFDDQIAVDDRGGRAFDRHGRRARDRPFAVERPAQRIDDAAQQLQTHRRSHHIARAGDAVARLDAIDVVEQHAADAFLAERLNEAKLPALEF